MFNSSCNGTWRRLAISVLALPSFLAGGAAAMDASASSPGPPTGPVIEYHSPENVIWVRGFPRHAPATLDHILEADRLGEWNRMIYTPGCDAYTLNASLVIGGVSTWEPTYAQIGRPGHEREMLIVTGFVWIRPPRRSLEGPDGRPGLVNRLTVGNPSNDTIRATLTIERPAASGAPGLFMGYRSSAPGSERFCGGDLFVFNSAVTVLPSEDQRPAPEWVRSMSTACYGTDVRLIGARLSGLGLFGIRPDNSTIERTVFENGQLVLSLGYQRAVDCVFRNLECPVSGERIELIRCAFESNAVNWRLQNSMGYCVEAIDCRMGETRSPIELRKNTADRKALLNSGVPVEPFYIERRSLAVRVEDPHGNSVAGAIVSLTCPAEEATGMGAGAGPRADAAVHLATVRNPVTVTDRDGLTPRKAEDGALLPAVRRLRATDDPVKPRVETFAYRLTVEAAGFQRAERTLGQGDLASEVVTVALVGL